MYFCYHQSLTCFEGEEGTNILSKNRFTDIFCAHYRHICVKKCGSHKVTEKMLFFLHKNLILSIGQLLSSLRL